MTWPDEPRPGDRQGGAPRPGAASAHRGGGQGDDTPPDETRLRGPADRPRRLSREGRPRGGATGDRYPEPSGGWFVGGGRPPDRYADQGRQDGAPSRRPSGIRQLARLVATVCSLGVLLLAACGWGVVRHYDGRVHQVDLGIPTAGRPAASGRGTENILLVGSDSRTGTDGQFGEVEGQRSDTTILAHLDRDGTTTMVSFPRDLWVTIPSYRAGGATHQARPSKLNAAFSLGGPALLVRTIEGLTGIRINHYVQVDFGGFQAITDALGGVTVCVEQLPESLRARGFDNLHDKMSGWSGQVGENHLDGAQALAFVRQRYGLPGGDLDRIRRQQQFLGVVFHAMTAPSTLANPARIRAVLDATTAALTVNRGTSLADLEPLALRMRALTAGGSGFETVPATPATRSGQSVLLIDQAKLAAFLAPLRPGGRPAASAAGVSAGGATAVRMAARPAAGLVSLTVATDAATRRVGTAQVVSSASTTATPSTSCTY